LQLVDSLWRQGPIAKTVEANQSGSLVGQTGLLLQEMRRKSWRGLMRRRLVPMRLRLMLTADFQLIEHLES
jgi:hypothetical protein